MNLNFDDLLIQAAEKMPHVLLASKNLAAQKRRLESDWQLCGRILFDERVQDEHAVWGIAEIMAMIERPGKEFVAERSIESSCLWLGLHYFGQLSTSDMPCTWGRRSGDLSSLTERLGFSFFDPKCQVVADGNQFRGAFKCPNGIFGSREAVPPTEREREAAIAEIAKCKWAKAWERRSIPPGKYNSDQDLIVVVPLEIVRPDVSITSIIQKWIQDELRAASQP